MKELEEYERWLRQHYAKKQNYILDMDLLKKMLNLVRTAEGPRQSGMLAYGIAAIMEECYQQRLAKELADAKSA